MQTSLTSAIRLFICLVVKFEIVDMVDPTDEEAVEKLKAKIEKKPEIDKRSKSSKQTTSQGESSNNDEEVPF